MKAKVTLSKGSSFKGVVESGHGVVMDVSPKLGGQNLGPRPMEMILLGLGGCTAIDVLQILRKARQQVVNMEVQLEGKRSSEDPKVFKNIQINVVLSGKKLDEHKVGRAIDLSAEKYCSVSMMLNKTADISYDFKILETTDPTLS